MAGITGIIEKNSNSQIALNSSIYSMMNKLTYSKLQLQQIFIDKNVAFGNVVPISAKSNDHFIYNSTLNIYTVVDGLVFINDYERNALSKNYDIDHHINDYQLLPYLYDLYKEEFLKHITGWFNIFIYDKKSKESLLCNDPLGYLPLYVYESDSLLIFGSKIKAILSSGLMSKIEFDPVTITEHLFFNYPLSDNTYIKDIYTLSNAEIITLKNGRVEQQKYWTIKELFNYDPVNEKESFELMNSGLKNAIGKINSRFTDKMNFSLTGGWDSRVVLSYFLPELKDKLNLYSFGAEYSDDILVPKEIASKENLSYTPYILDENYLENSFIPYAEKTILLSNGTRNYKRTHYLYAIAQISNISNIVLTGIFGDEVFKTAQAVGGTVLSQNTIDLIANDFNISSTLHKLKGSGILSLMTSNSKSTLDEIAFRLNHIKDYMESFHSKSERYYSIRFEYNLRKYFGNEVNSYNDFVYCFSPFIDLDFLNNFARTTYFGIHYPFNSNKLNLKKKATKLYYKITYANYSPLTKYNSSRGYSMEDSVSIYGNTKILVKKYMRQKTKVDGFNTKPTDQLFKKHLIHNSSNNYNNIFTKNNMNKNDIISDLNSLKYFVAVKQDIYKQL